MWAIVWTMMLSGGSLLSVIKSDEVVVFFPTYGRLDECGQTWNVTIHGWIFEPEEGSSKRAAALKVFGRFLGLEEGAEDTDLFRRRARAFLVDNERGKQLSVRLGGEVYPLEASAPNGHFHGSLALSADEAQRLLARPAVTDRWLPFEAVTRPGDERVFAGSVKLVEPEGWSVVSDIDDTIKISEVADRKALLRNTFLRQFEAVPGMADVYRGWAEQGAVFHYVSASPWQLYAPLDAFRAEGVFPAGTFHMKLVRWKDSTALDLFASPEKFKPGAIEPILADFPRRQFVFVGDSGERDPEIYGELARRHPDQVVRILIRNVTDEAPDSDRFQRAFEGLPADRWLVFDRPEEFEGLELLPREGR